MKAFWLQVPQVVRIATATAAGLGVFLIVLNVLNATLSPGAFQVIANLLGPAVVVGVFVGARRVMNRRLGGRGQVKLYRQALRTGSIPDGANREKWRTFIRAVYERNAAERAKRVWTWLWLPIVVGIAVLAAGFLTAPGDMGEVSGRDVVVSIGTFIIVLMGLVLFLTVLTRLGPRIGKNRLDRLAKTLDS